MSYHKGLYWECRDCGYYFQHRYRSTTPARCPVCNGTIHPITFSYYSQLLQDDKFRPVKKVIHQGNPVELTVDDVWRMADEELSGVKTCKFCGGVCSAN